MNPGVMHVTQTLGRWLAAGQKLLMFHYEYQRVKHGTCAQCARLSRGVAIFGECDCALGFLTMDKVSECLGEFRKIADDWLKSKTDVRDDFVFFQEFREPKFLATAQWSDFQKIGGHLNCFRRMPLARTKALGKPNHPIEKYRASFSFLIHGAPPLAERVRRFRDDDEYSLEYFGDSAVSELVGYIFPSEFIFYNARDVFAVQFLEIEPVFPPGADFVTRLTQISAAVKPVVEAYEKIVERRTELPVLLELDQFFSWIYEENSEEETPSKSYWVIGASEGAVRWDDFYKTGVVTIGWGKVGNLKAYKSQSEILASLKKEYGADETPTNDAKACFDFANRIEIGDGIYVKQGRTKILGFGTVDSEYLFDESRESHSHIRKVQWLKKGEFVLPPGRSLSIKCLTKVNDPELLQELELAIKVQQPETDETESLESDRNYWWLNANPQIWDFATAKIGDKQTYTTHNDKGNKRQKYKYFLEAKPGDLVIGYVTSPYREVVSICQITKGIHQHPEGESIEFEKIEQLLQPISLEELQQMPALQEAEPISNNQGSLFRLTRDEFSAIRSLIDSSPQSPPPVVPKYTEEDALKSLFIPPSHFHLMLDSLRQKKNLILQGPPGVGKTFVARELSYALLGEKNSSRIKWAQFHQSYSYEDFVQGFRPTDKGSFELKDGIFYQFCRMAQRDRERRPFVFVIDEINRGNMSKIFGELLMLLEPDKRGPSFAIPLTYSKDGDETFFVPENLYLIGMMNTADRSLAMVDYALRRRFRFINLEPAFGSEGFREQLRRGSADDTLIGRIVNRFVELNEHIASDAKHLGPAYTIGHSYFCIREGMIANEEWYRRIVEWEIKPLIEEYWFDDPTTVATTVARLLE
jgi:5-methylcytosine-specific restriction protein B